MSISRRDLLRRSALAGGAASLGVFHPDALFGPVVATVLEIAGLFGGGIPLGLVTGWAACRLEERGGGDSSPGNRAPLARVPVTGDRDAEPDAQARPRPGR